ncbi:uncharacterized protein LOC108904209 [Anoplophora glabripennis]|uniref:uncharacterized protein LOC108904209 n=1 Tax=Anoplophora glabripennis TaxID=217634 RepID=UPI0008736676|nr:uncharacterized protein LOC108904209 [Anoplophora glabripennis]
MTNPSKLTWMRGRKLFYGFCPDCSLNMAAVPQGAFAAKKVRKNEEKRKEFHYTTELNPMNYSSKYMNSIWGQYNRYSVHNLKKIMDDGVFAMSVGKGKRSTAATQPVEKPAISTDLGPVGSAISFSSNKIYN